MKTTFLLSSLLLILFSCNFSTDEDFKAIAKDTCDCMSMFTDELSDEMKTILIETEGNEAAFDEAFDKYLEEKPMEGMKDAVALSGADSPEIMECIQKMEKKYENVYTTLSENEILEKVLAELEKMDGCDATAAIMKMGMAAQ